MNFLKKIFSPSILIISLLLFIYTFYRSEIIWDGIERDYFFTYYLISIVLIIFSIISFFFNTRVKEHLIILGLSIVVGLYLVEGYLTYQAKIPFKKLYEIQTEKKWDTRTKFEIYNDMKKTNNEIQIPMGTRYYILNNSSEVALSGVSNSQTIHCNENGYYSIYQSDRYGFNNPDTEWDEKEIEYLLVGDSFTHGACVNRPNDIASVLRTISNKSVLNLGYGANGALAEYATLREYLNSNVKKILWVHHERNSFTYLSDEISNKILKKYLNDLTYTQNLNSRQNDIDNMAIDAINKERAKGEVKKTNIAKIKGFIKVSNLRSLIFPPPTGLKPPAEFKQILQLTKDLAIQNNSKLYFIYLPEISRYKKKYDNTTYNEVQKLVKKLNIPIIDIHKEVLQREKKPTKLYPYETSGHFTVEGYKKIAEKIYEFTKD